MSTGHITQVAASEYYPAVLKSCRSRSDAHDKVKPKTRKRDYGLFGQVHEQAKCLHSLDIPTRNG